MPTAQPAKFPGVAQLDVSHFAKLLLHGGYGLTTACEDSSAAVRILYGGLRFGGASPRMLSHARVTARAEILHRCAIGMLMSRFGTRLGVDYVLAFRGPSLRGGFPGWR